MLKRSVLVAAAVCIVAMSVLGMSACVFDSDSNVILAKHHFTVEKYDLPEGVASLEVDSDYETDGKGSYVTNGEYIRFEMYLLSGYELGTLKLQSGYELGTLKLHISDDKYGERNLEFTAYESHIPGKPVYRTSFYVYDDFTAYLGGAPVKTAG